MEFSELMRRFGEEFGLDDFKPSEDGLWNVAIDGLRIAFAEMADPPRARMLALLCPLPVQGREAFLQALMDAMFMGRATDGASFFVDEKDRVFLQRTDPLPLLDYEAFKMTLGRFANVLEQWRDVVAEFGAVAGDLEKTEHDAADEARRMNVDGFIKV